MSVLISSGAGFLGSRPAGALIARGERVRVLDPLIPRHHLDAGIVRDLLSISEFHAGERQRSGCLAAALDGIDVDP
jgi:dTDP-L-rhamnose 4-epimerase